tara:strand:- start:215 stop:358 length:144 start_codon:yes stop_codon:yes gene_type:complete
MSKKKQNKKLPVYEVVFNEEKSDGVVSINLTDKPLFGEFTKTENIKL